MSDNANDRAAKNAAISAKILIKVSEGLTIRQAIDAVCGAGTVDRVITEVYNAARKGA